MTQEYKISEELAVDEFDRWAEAMDLDIDLKGMDEEDKSAFAKQKRRIVLAIARGELILNDEDEAVFTPANPKSLYREPITFRERTGASLMAMDGQKKGRDAAKTYAVMGDITGLPPKTFAGLRGRDIKVCEALFALLMD